RRREDRRSHASGLRPREKEPASRTGKLPAGRRAQDRRLVRSTAVRRSILRRRGRRLPQHQHAGGTEARMTRIADAVSCLDGYDPNALHVEKAREAIRGCLPPLTEAETVRTREALGRVLAQDIVPSINVPAHDNSAMDGYAVRFSDLREGEATILTEVGAALAGRPFQGTLGAGQCVRIMTGAVM